MRFFKLYKAFRNFKKGLGLNKRYVKPLRDTIHTLNMIRHLNKQNKGLGDNYYKSFILENYCVHIDDFKDFGIKIKEKEDENN